MLPKRLLHLSPFTFHASSPTCSSLLFAAVLQHLCDLLLSSNVAFTWRVHHDGDADRVTDRCTAKFECDAAFYVVENCWCPVDRRSIRKIFSNFVKCSADLDPA